MVMSSSAGRSMQQPRSKQIHTSLIDFFIVYETKCQSWQKAMGIVESNTATINRAQRLVWFPKKSIQRAVNLKQTQ